MVHGKTIWQEAGRPSFEPRSEKLDLQLRRKEPRRGRYIGLDEIKRQIRAQVQKKNPDLRPAEIELRVERRIARGMQSHRPTSPPVRAFS